jgi:hypothetical protein
MTPLEIGAAVAVATVVVLLIGVPVAFALGGVTLGALLWLEGPSGLDAVAETFLGALEDFTLVAVPLFIVMGVAASLSAAGGDMREMIKRWLHNLPGGLIVANVCASALFSGLSSTGSATCMAVGRDGLPELRERRYADGLAAGAIAASGTLGILIPPSLTMIVYGIAADLSIGRLFLAGLLPGLMLTGLFAIWSLLAARRSCPGPCRSSPSSPACCMRCGPGLPGRPRPPPWPPRPASSSSRSSTGCGVPQSCGGFSARAPARPRRCSSSSPRRPCLPTCWPILPSPTPSWGRCWSWTPAAGS